MELLLPSDYGDEVPLTISMLRIWPVIPAGFLAYPAIAGSPDLISYASQILGLDAMACILACLAISPLVTMSRLRVTELRTWYGLWTFLLGAAGLVIAVSVNSPGGVMERAAGDSMNWTGLLVVVLLLPLAATSFKAAQKVMGPEWKRWQRGLVWCVWAVIGLHLFVLMAWASLVGYATASLPLIAARDNKIKTALREWRREGYSNGRMWFMVDVLVLVYATGMSLIIWREVVACAAAVTLTPVS